MKFKNLEMDPSKIMESLVVKPQIPTDSSKKLNESAFGLEYLLPRIEAIHAGPTRNFTRYPAAKLQGDKELKSGVYSWLHPFAKPVIYNHDTDTDATGRIQTASFSEFTQAGRPGIIVVPKITDKKAIQGVLDERLLTVSIGATTDAAICSTCGTDIISEGWCGHMKGEENDGSITEWIVGNVWFDELSWVNVPADQDAMVVDQGQSVAMTEAFGVKDREIIDLSKKSTEWVVDINTAKQQGLVVAEQEGEIPLNEKEIKKLQSDLKEATNTRDKLQEDFDETKTKLSEATDQLKEAETKLSEKDQEVTTLNEKVEGLEKDLSEATEAQDSLKQEKETLEESLEQEKQAKDNALEENTKLVAESHADLVDQVVSLRIDLGKEKANNRDAAMETYAARSFESLKDSLADLKGEKSHFKVEPVSNPGFSNTESQGKKKDGKVSNEDALRGLFSSGIRK